MVEDARNPSAPKRPTTGRPGAPCGAGPGPASPIWASSPMWRSTLHHGQGRPDRRHRLRAQRRDARVLAKRALCHAQAGAPMWWRLPDMMDGRVAHRAGSIPPARSTPVSWRIRPSTRRASTARSVTRWVLPAIWAKGNNTRTRWIRRNSDGPCEVAPTSREGADMFMVKPGMPLSRHRPPGEVRSRRCLPRLSGERRVRHAEGRGGQRLAQREAVRWKPWWPSSAPVPTASSPITRWTPPAG